MKQIVIALLLVFATASAWMAGANGWGLTENTDEHEKVARSAREGSIGHGHGGGVWIFFTGRSHLSGGLRGGK